MVQKIVGNYVQSPSKTPQLRTWHLEEAFINVYELNEF